MKPQQARCTKCAADGQPDDSVLVSMARSLFQWRGNAAGGGHGIDSPAADDRARPHREEHRQLTQDPWVRLAIAAAYNALAGDLSLSQLLLVESPGAVLPVVAAPAGWPGPDWGLSTTGSGDWPGEGSGPGSDPASPLHPWPGSPGGDFSAETVALDRAPPVPGLPAQDAELLARLQDPIDRLLKTFAETLQHQLNGPIYDKVAPLASCPCVTALFLGNLERYFFKQFHSHIYALPTEVYRDQLAAVNVRRHRWIEGRHLDLPAGLVPAFPFGVADDPALGLLSAVIGPSPAGAVSAPAVSPDSAGRTLRAFQLCVDALGQMGQCFAPGQKIERLMLAVRLIIRILRTAGMVSSAEHMLPLLVVALCRSSLYECMVATVQFLTRFRPETTAPEEDYYMMMFTTAVHFLETLDRKSLSITDGEYHRLVTAFREYARSEESLAKARAALDPYAGLLSHLGPETANASETAGLPGTAGGGALAALLPGPGVVAMAASLAPGPGSGGGTPGQVAVSSASLSLEPVRAFSDAPAGGWNRTGRTNPKARAAPPVSEEKPSPISDEDFVWQQQQQQSPSPN
ncbi:hypothetical protein H696_06297 [Fonticula alba]|uniref:VPS9 domain-containing protein n=1 Tax=Fonticula alba TaxID=691883 RepID=A0A058YZ62_FONAL|nr:hypothetical protein H696_06297 [Fonticula alba]KCV67279.1 hypothetical protein H696_06297 [Fonticula alba]|eukprot:XP_009498315.1 hypothetical protein H696_06297 [Fonticula alba]